MVVRLRVLRIATASLFDLSQEATAMRAKTPVKAEAATHFYFLSVDVKAA